MKKERYTWSLIWRVPVGLFLLLFAGLWACLAYIFVLISFVSGIVDRTGELIWTKMVDMIPDFRKEKPRKPCSDKEYYDVLMEVGRLAMNMRSVKNLDAAVKRSSKEYDPVVVRAREIRKLLRLATQLRTSGIKLENIGIATQMRDKLREARKVKL